MLCVAEVGVLVRNTRRARGLSQKALGVRAAVTPAALSEAERGLRDLRGSTIERLLASTGHQLIAIPTRRADTATLADRIGHELAAGSAGGALREYIQLADNLAAEHRTTRLALTLTAPPPTGEKRWDAAIAALVEHRLTEEQLPYPDWTAEPARTLARSWTLGAGRYVQPVDPARVPARFRAHGVLIDPDFLASI